MKDTSPVSHELAVCDIHRYCRPTVPKIRYSEGSLSQKVRVRVRIRVRVSRVRFIGLELVDLRNSGPQSIHMGLHLSIKCIITPVS